MAGVMKQFAMPMEDVLWKHSWINLVMLTAPFLDKDKKEDETKVIDPMELYRTYNGS